MSHAELIEQLRALSRAEHDDLSIASEAADALAAQEWQTIDTAPKDGTKVDLLYPYPRGRTIDCWWETEGPLAGAWIWLDKPKHHKGELLPESEWGHRLYINMEPTHWRPRPFPPPP